MDHDLTRRQALTVAAACACACALGADDDSSSSAPKKPPVESLKIGKLSDFPKPGYYDKHVENKVFVSRLEDRLVVMSALCTHKQCVLKINDDTSLRCPCHRSIFSEQGTPLEGKAKVALMRYALKQDADGTITADLTKSFGEKDWDKPESFIALRA